jgi:transcriptional regulator GlxA family with amidase domain
MQTSCQKRFDVEKKELESSHKVMVQELQKKISKLTVANSVSFLVRQFHGHFFSYEQSTT